VRYAETGAVGLLIGFLIGAVLALAIGRGDRRLRQRDQIANSIGVPVLASVAAGHPRDAASWAKLFENYKPNAVDAWRLRMTLHELGLAGQNAGDPADPDGPEARGSSSLAVLSLSSDRNALVLGPQLAAYAASQGIKTALVVGPQQNENVTAALYAACAAVGTTDSRSGNLRVTVSAHDSAAELTGAALTIVVAVVDGQHPRVGQTMHASNTVLGVTAGVVAAEQLARVASSAAAAGREIAGILVADPDPDDSTTGRMPHVGRPGRRRTPAHALNVATETRR
jgi:hypothetical protein